MNGIQTLFALSYLNGKRIANYDNKNDLINDCEGVKNFEFSSEVFEAGKIINWKGSELKIDSIEVEFQSILIDEIRISDNSEKISKTSILVIIYIED
ncbi:hypothetical protein [Flavobacterium sp.]|uniref:hypothetical protein n=1 Tax=Flavobacterium sp. TaxID=239 RepID=UPI002FDEB984